MRTAIRNPRHAILLALALAVPAIAWAGVTGTEFQALYQWAYDALSGYLGRAVAITSGLVGLLIAAFGRLTMAATPIAVAVGVGFGPNILDTIAGTATI